MKPMLIRQVRSSLLFVWAVLATSCRDTPTPKEDSVVFDEEPPRPTDVTTPTAERIYVDIARVSIGQGIPECDSLARMRPWQP